MHTTILEIQQLMQTLGLEDEERNAWSQVLPVMNEEEVHALHTNLKTQFEKMTDIYLTALESRTA